MDTCYAGERDEEQVAELQVAGLEERSVVMRPSSIPAAPGKGLAWGHHEQADPNLRGLARWSVAVGR